MKLLPIFYTSFKGKPQNYQKIDEFVSRSAQPQKEDFRWLKEQGVTDVFNFRTMYKSGIDFEEKEVVESLGMKYHNIPSITKKPSEDNIKLFLDKITEIIKLGGKPHLHCKAGADRTGMYSYIYKSVMNIGNSSANQAEMIKMGHNLNLYPDLLPWTNRFISKLKQSK